MIYYSFVCSVFDREREQGRFRGSSREKVIDDTKPYRAPANLLGLAYMDFPAIREVPYFLPLSYLTLDSDGFCSRFSSCKRKRGNVLCSQEVAIRFFNSLLTGDI